MLGFDGGGGENHQTVLEEQPNQRRQPTEFLGFFMRSCILEDFSQSATSNTTQTNKTKIYGPTAAILTLQT